MLDTDDLAALPGGVRADLLAYYADLVHTPADLAALEARWPAVVLIERGLGDPLGLASAIDVEQHAEGVAAVKPWAAAQGAHGVRYLAVYANRSTMPAVDAAGWTGYRWYATLDGTAHIDGRPAGLAPAAVQCLSAAMLGFHADLSLVFEDGWHPSPPAGLSPADRAALATARTRAQGVIDALDVIR